MLLRHPRPDRPRGPSAVAQAPSANGRASASAAPMTTLEETGDFGMERKSLLAALVDIGTTPVSKRELDCLSVGGAYEKVPGRCLLCGVAGGWMQ